MTSPPIDLCRENGTFMGGSAGALRQTQDKLSPSLDPLFDRAWEGEAPAEPTDDVTCL